MFFSIDDLNPDYLVNLIIILTVSLFILYGLYHQTVGKLKAMEMIVDTKEYHLQALEDQVHFFRSQIDAETANAIRSEYE